MKGTTLAKMLVLGLILVVCRAELSQAAPMGTAWTYQGRLIDANNAADGLYDFQFKLYDVNVAGTQKAGTLNIGEVDVIDGYFTVLLDFSSGVFDGNDRWLQIAVRAGDLNDPNVYTTLSPRQELTATPYAIYAKTADSISVGIDWIEIFNRPAGLDDGDQVGITSETDPVYRGSAASAITTGNIINWNTAYGWGNHALAGYLTTETDPTVPASIKDGIAWLEVSSRPAGLDDGDQVGITSETDPTVLASVKDGISWSEVSNRPAGLDDGDQVGITSETDPTVLASVKDGISWSEVSNRPAGLDDGDDIGITIETDPQVGSNITNYITKWDGSELVSGTIYDSGNVGIGTTSPTNKLDVNGFINSNESYKLDGDTVIANPETGNIFIGVGAGASNTTGWYNTFSGYQAGYSNTTGSRNTFFGTEAGLSNTTGLYNTFSGHQAGYSNTTGWNNTFTGYAAGYSNTTGDNNTFLGPLTGWNCVTGSGNVFIGYDAGSSETGSNKLYIANSYGTALIYGDFSTGRVGIGTIAPTEKLDVGGNIRTGQDGSGGQLILAATDSIAEGGQILWNGAGSYDDWFQDIYENRMRLFTSSAFNNQVQIFNASSGYAGLYVQGNVGIGTTSPSEKLDVDGTARLRGIGSSSGTTVVADGNGKLWKSSSSQRYKTNIEPLDADTDAVLKLRPVRFQWRTTGQNDIGLIAEEVEQQLNDLVIYDNEGRPDAVKYDRVSLYLLGVVKDLKAENESLKQRLTSLETTVQHLTKGKEFEP